LIIFAYQIKRRDLDMFVKGKKTIIFVLILAILFSLTSGITASSTKTLVYYDGFEDNKANPKAIFRFNAWHKIENEQLYMGFNINDNDWGEAAEAYIANQRLDFDEENKKYEYVVKFNSNGFRNDLWYSCMVGIRVAGNDKNDFKPGDANSGLYVGIAHTNKAVVYHGSGGWPGGAFSIDIPANFAETNTLYIVDDNDTVRYYMDTPEEPRVLFLSIKISGDMLTAYDKDDNIIYEAANNLKGQTGYFKIFSHSTKTIVDSIEIYSVDDSVPTAPEAAASYSGSQIRSTLVPFRTKSGEIVDSDLRQGLRFCFDVMGVGEVFDYEGKEYTVKDLGGLVILKDKLSDPNIMVLEQVGKIDGLVAQPEMIDVDVNGNMYKSIYIYNIPDTAKETIILARVWLECEDSDGNIIYLYTSVQENSLSRVYQEIVENNEADSLDPAVRSWFE
jgi:hypothetical protein